MEATSPPSSVRFGTQTRPRLDDLEGISRSYGNAGATVDAGVTLLLTGDASCLRATKGPGDGALLCAGLAATFLFRAPAEELRRGRVPRVADGFRFGT
jgi:hypothetical protein